MNKQMIIVVALVVLVVISGIQAVQLNTLKSQLEEGGAIKTSSAKTSAASSGSSSGAVSTPKSLQNLPQMVGGC